MEDRIAISQVQCGRDACSGLLAVALREADEKDALFGHHQFEGTVICSRCGKIHADVVGCSLRDVCQHLGGNNNAIPR